MELRPYQTELYAGVKKALRKHRTVFLQLHCGGGKTVIFSKMAETASSRGFVTWIIVPRDELLEQASATLSAIGVVHGRIDARHKESAVFSVQLVSINTLNRRWDKIKRPPDFVIVDEGHLFYDRQAEIHARYPDAKIVAVSATPELLSGKGLAKLYPVLVEGPSLKDLVEMDYLVRPELYAPKLDGLETVRRRGIECDETELSALFAKNKTYGRAVEKYEKHARGRTALAFARSVKEAHKVAKEFRHAGYDFRPISGQTPGRERKALVDALRDHEIDGLVNCEIATYGLDVPTLGAVILLRPTKSRALFTQMVWRGGRSSAGKTDFVVLDHVNMYKEFGHPLKPHIWNFEGNQKKEKPDERERASKICPETERYCEEPSCAGCEHNVRDIKSRISAIIDCELEKIDSPVPLADRTNDERREYTDRTNKAVAEYEKTMSPGPIGELLKIAKVTNQKPIWVYWMLSKGRYSVNVTVLYEIARQCGYKTGWTWNKKKEIETEMRKQGR